MPYIIEEEKKVWWPVVVPEPINGGKVERRKFQLEFTVEDPEDWFEEEPGEDGEKVPETVEAVLRRVVTNWKDVVGADKKPVEFDSLRFEQMLKKGRNLSAIWAAYREEVVPGIAAKN